MRSNELLNEALREAASEAPSEEPINRCDSWRGPAQREAPRRAETTKENRRTTDRPQASAPTHTRRARRAGALMIDSCCTERASNLTNHVGGTHLWQGCGVLRLSIEKYVV